MSEPLMGLKLTKTATPRGWIIHFRNPTIRKIGKYDPMQRIPTFFDAARYYINFIWPHDCIWRYPKGDHTGPIPGRYFCQSVEVDIDGEFRKFEIRITQK